MSLYNILLIKFFLTKLDSVAVNVKPWLRLRRYPSQLPWEGKKKMKNMVPII